MVDSPSGAGEQERGRWVEPLFELGALHFSGGSTPLPSLLSLFHTAPPNPGITSLHSGIDVRRAHVTARGVGLGSRGGAEG